MARHIRKGDTVKITAGKDKGRTGKVLRVVTDRENPNLERVVVAGINVSKKTRKPSQGNPQGGISNIEMPVHISNVSPVDKDGKASRVRFKTNSNGSKVRLAATTGEQLGPELRKAR